MTEPAPEETPKASPSTEPVPTAPLRLEVPEAAAPEPAIGSVLDLEPRPRSRGRLGTTLVAAALGNELGVTGALLGTTALVFVGLGAAYSQNCHGACLPEPAFRWGVLLTAVLAPPVLALSTTHVLLKLARRDPTSVYSWRATFLTGLVVNGVVAMVAAGFFQEVLVRQGTVPGLITAGVGAAVSAAAQVLVLNLTRRPASVVPVVLPGGGGVAVGSTF